MTTDFDIIKYLDDNEIDYWLGGKNVQRGWVNIACPFCYDNSNHLGINLETKLFHCWVCGEKGGPEKLVMALQETYFNEAQNIVEIYSNGEGLYKGIDPEEKTSSRGDLRALWAKFREDLPQIYIDYLKERDFDPDRIIPAFNLRAQGPVGKWKFRIIAPVLVNGEVVSFVARSITDSDPKYLHCPNNLSVIPIKKTLYNLDTVKKNILIVEGVTDVWRFGDGCVATYGMEVSWEQIMLLKKKNLKRFYIMFDGESEAIRNAEKLAGRLLDFIPYGEVLRLGEGDPAEIDQTDADELRMELGL